MSDDVVAHAVREPVLANRYLLARSRSPVAADDIMKFTLDGTPVDPRGQRMYAERAIHGTMYTARPVIPYTVTPLELRPVFHRGSVIGPLGPLWDSQAEFGDTDMPIDDLPRGLALAQALGQGRTMLLFDMPLARAWDYWLTRAGFGGI